MTQNNLGVTLKDQGLEIRGIEGRRLLEQAISAYERALEVHTRDHLPGPWEMTYRNLGSALFHLGRRDEAESVFADLGESIPEGLEVLGDDQPK